VKFALEGTVASQVRLPEVSHILIVKVARNNVRGIRVSRNGPIRPMQATLTSFFTTVGVKLAAMGYDPCFQ
jgi:hypothetical protein